MELGLCGSSGPVITTANRHAQRTARRALHTSAIAHSHPRASSVVLGDVLAHDGQQGPGILAHSEGMHMGRRQVLMGPALGLALAVLLKGEPASADVEGLPKAYQDVVRKLCKSLRESIQAEQAGDSEAEVRRKADPAKEALQTFVKRWRDDPKVIGHPSHDQIIGVLSELGAFYGKAGPRARMPQDVQARLLDRLSTAEEAFNNDKKFKGGVLALPLPGQEADDDDDLRGLLPV